MVAHSVVKATAHCIALYVIYVDGSYCSISVGFRNEGFLLGYDLIHITFGHYVHMHHDLTVSALNTHGKAFEERAEPTYSSYDSGLEFILEVGVDVATSLKV